MIKLIASDMDGTLLNNEHKIPKKNVELIKYAQNNNIEFVVATGRAYYEALPALEENNIICDVISFNGGVVYNKNKEIISITPIQVKDLYYTIGIFKSLEISYQLYTKNTVYTHSIETDIQAYADLIRSIGSTPDLEYLRAESKKRLQNGHVTEVENIELYLNQEHNPSIKIIGISNDLDKLKKAKKLLSENENIAVTSSGANNLEVMDKNATKGHALKQVSKAYKISLKNTLAIGDNLNDEAMLKIVEYSVAIFELLSIHNNQKDEEINRLLINKAIEATKFSYVPYSEFKVGAALLTEDGEIYTGCNIENASYTPTNCAERTAIFKAVSEGITKFKKIAVVGGPKGNIETYCPPCGVCRQVIAEFADENFELILGTSENNYEVYNFFKEVLPLSFTKNNLK